MSTSSASRTYGTVSAERRKEMTGLEFVQGLADRTLPLNTIARTLGYDVIEAADGRVVVTAVPSDDLDRKSTRLNSSHYSRSRMPSSA